MLAFEMMYTLIDIEGQAQYKNDRKGITERLEDCIKKTFYQDEEDARQYYENQVTRKKEYGGKYNERFLSNVKEDGPEYGYYENGEDQE